VNVRPRLLFLLAIPLAAAIAVRVHPAGAGSARAGCDSALEPLKTLSDPQRRLVHLRPRATTVQAINGRPMPRSTPRTRSTGFSRQVWRVRAQVVEYRLERDGGVSLVLYDGKHSYMNAAMPPTRCLSALTRGRREIVAARAFFEGLCGPARPAWRPNGAVVTIDGVGFWSVPRNHDGHARNYAELHPVTGIHLVAGCG
jgi:hypothetical protein